MSVLMVDCISENVHAVAAQFGVTTPVAGYVTGGPPIEWSEDQFAPFTRKIRIAQSQDFTLDEDSPARVLDVERFAATPEMWPEWFASRTDKPRATCYCSLSSVPAVVDAARQANPDGSLEPPRWWLAWYWGQPGYPTVAQTLAELNRLTGFELDPQSVWAVQYVNYPLWDQSRVYGTPDFSRR